MDKIMVNYTTQKPQGYIVGSLFSDSEVRQRLYEGQQLKGNTNINFYNPIEAPVNKKDKLPTADDIFNMDTEKVLKANVIVADLSDNDVGGAFELGITWMSNYIHYLKENGYSLDDIVRYIPKKKVYSHLSDIRKSTGHGYRGNYLPWGTNQYQLAGVEQIGEVCDHFEDILEKLKEA